ncbi:MAG TPA: hypothetical protein VMN78_04665 [Longimicrobiales bacterium]|nr:hypothetical protein [Longimicrobiales bacterium]
MRLIRPLLLGSLALTIAACAGARPAGETLVTASGEPLTSTHIVNANPYPVTIYLTQPGMQHRLGVVESLSGASFMVPERALEGRLDFRLVASPLGPHATLVSETFMLQPGQSANWRIQETTSQQTAFLSLVSVR